METFTSVVPTGRERGAGSVSGAAARDFHPVCWDGGSATTADAELPGSSSISMLTTTTRGIEPGHAAKGGGGDDVDGESELMLEPPAPMQMTTRGHDPDELGLSWGKRSALGESMGVVAPQRATTRDPPGRQQRPLIAADEERRRALQAISTGGIGGERSGGGGGGGGAVGKMTAEERRVALDELIGGGGGGIPTAEGRPPLSSPQRQAELDSIIQGR